MRRCGMLLGVDARATSILERLRHVRDVVKGSIYGPLAMVAENSSSRDVILEDVRAWTEYWPREDEEVLVPRKQLVVLLAESPAFRNLLYYRLSHGPSTRDQMVLPVLRTIWKPEPTLHLFPDSLGPGCRVLHGWSTAVAARSVGRNFFVGPQVCIGYSGANKYPTIGNDVHVMAGALVLGDITIGDGAVIMAGAVVLSDVAPHTTVVGVPARPTIHRDPTALSNRAGGAASE